MTYTQYSQILYAVTKYPFSPKVDLQTVRNVTGLATQGYLYGSVTSYQIMYSINGKQWFQYKDNSTMKAKVCKNFYEAPYLYLYMHFPNFIPN